MDYAKSRELMVRTQLIPRGIKDRRVLDAMGRVPRHLFFDDSMQQNAYEDMALPIGEGQTISQPFMVAVMTELLELRGNEKVLEIGTGSGYQAAVLSELAAEVYTVERIPSLAESAQRRFSCLHYSNIQIKVSDGTLGWPEKSPFDRILITAASPEIPGPLIGQLGIPGILIAPVGTKYSQQLLKVRRGLKGIDEEYHTHCVFVPLIGEHGWKQE